MALVGWDAYDALVALMTPGVDLETDPLERASRDGMRIPSDAADSRRSAGEPVVAGQGSTPGVCHHCGRDTRSKRRHSGLCDRCYQRWRRGANAT